MTEKTLLFESLKDKVHSSNLSVIFERYKNIKTLSLDCFDTLLWRKTASPVDVFYALQDKPTFKSIGLSALLRRQVESKARQNKLFKENHSEVKLYDIYHTFDPQLSQEQLKSLSEEELLAEKQVCYGFPPIIDLIRYAHQIGITIIIVSDTYLSQLELSELLKHALPNDVFNMISKIYCSSEYKRSKCSGLFHTIIKEYTDQNFLHIGDNINADYIAPRSLKLNAMHFVHENESIADIQRLHAISSCVIDSNIRSLKPLYNPFSGILAKIPASDNQPHNIIGYASLGPLMYVFAQYICEEVEKIQLQGKTPKVVFLMRDAYLPSLACEAFSGKKMGYNIRISRFSAVAASFMTELDVEEYLMSIGRSNRFHDLARQLLLPLKVVEPLIKIAERSNDPESEFAHLVCRKDILKIIINKSAEYRERLIRYLENKIELKAGDTLMLVDLGYSGTAQRKLTPIFKSMNVEIIGRYLIALSTLDSHNDRAGLMDPSWCDERTLHMLVGFIAMLEQLCTTRENSVIDYDKNGNEIFSEVLIEEQQYSRLEQIQQESLRFIRDAKQFFALPNTSSSNLIMREYVVAELARMIYLPTGPELEYLKAFQFDVNMGTTDTYRLFDPAKGLAGLKRRGLFYMERNTRTRRTNYPAELRLAGFEIAFTSMIQNRLSLDLKISDMLQRQELIPTILTQYNAVDHIELEAKATMDGYYYVCAPAGTSVQFMLGKRYQWIQVECVELVPMHAFANQREEEYIIDALGVTVFHEMTGKGAGLYECASENSAILVKTPSNINGSDYVLRFVFRPIVSQLKVENQNNPGFKASFEINI